MRDTSRKPVIALALITAVCLAGDSMLYVVLPTHWKEAGLASLVQAGILLSVNRFVRLPLNPVIGWIYNRFSFRHSLLIAVLFSGITTIGYGFVKDFDVWVVLRVLWGFSWSLFKLGSYLLILQIATDSNRSGLVGAYNGLYRIGSLFGMLLGGLFADLFGISAISIIIGSASFLTVPFLYRYIPAQLKKEKPENKPGMLGHFMVFRSRWLLKIFLTAFLVMLLLDGMLTAMLSHIIQAQFTDEIPVAGLVIGAATLGGGVQALRWGLAPLIMTRVGSLMDTVKRKNILLAIFLAAAAFQLTVVSFKLPLAVWLLFMLVHLLTASSLITLLDAVMADHASAMAGKVFVMTSFTIVLDLGAALGPVMGYALEKRAGLDSVFWLGAGLCLLLSLLWAYPAQNRKRQMDNVQTL